jgi:pimeloyl-ACP methyl ester carboxylesterase
MPYRSMYPQIQHSFVEALLPRMLSEDLAVFSKAAADFALGCVAEGFELNEEMRLLSIGAIALQVYLSFFPLFPLHFPSSSLIQFVSFPVIILLSFFIKEEELFASVEEDRKYIILNKFQHPLARQHSLSRTQDETALLAVKDSLPFLVIYGEEDRILLADEVERFMNENFGRVEFHKLGGVGHAAFLERPEVVNRILLEWVRRICRGD